MDGDDAAGLESVEFDDVDLNNSDTSPRTVRWKQYLKLGNISRIEYERLLEQHPLPDLPQDNDEATQETDLSLQNTHLDPLTAMVKQEEDKQKLESQIELEYRKEKALRKRGGASTHIQEEEPDDDLANYSMIQKDLHRLSVPSSTQLSKDRNQILERILFVFASQHHNYLQGMHEVASFVLLAFELDRKVQEADVYFVFERILTSIYVSYDIGENHPQRTMSRRMIQKLIQIWPALAPKLHDVPVQLIFTKWMRLLFARDVQNVLEVWDALLEASSDAQCSLQDAAEAFGIARLWEHGNIILYLDDNLHWFMNMPVEENTKVLIKRMRFILGLSQEPLPLPGPVPPSIIAEQQQYIQQQIHQQNLQLAPQQQQQQRRTQPPESSSSNNALSTSLWSNSILSQTLGTANLTNLTEKITKRISQEWDHLQSVIPDHQSQHHSSSQQPPSNTYNLNYYSDALRRMPSQEPQQLSQSVAAPASPRRTMGEASSPRTRTDEIVSNPSPNRGMNGGAAMTTSLPANMAKSKLPPSPSRAQQLQRNVQVLQQFAIGCEQNHGVKVPGHVWGALAELQVLQQQLEAQDRNTQR